MNLQSWLSVKGITEYLGVSEKTIYFWLECKKTTKHVGKIFNFKSSVVEHWFTFGGATITGKQLEQNYA